MKPKGYERLPLNSRRAALSLGARDGRQPVRSEELLLESDASHASIVAKRTHASALPQFADSLIMPQMATRRTVRFCQRLRQLADTSRDGVRSWLF